MEVGTGKVKCFIVWPEEDIVVWEAFLDYWVGK